jgi:hypothetical protein
MQCTLWHIWLCHMEVGRKPVLSPKYMQGCNTDEEWTELPIVSEASPSQSGGGRLWIF